MAKKMKSVRGASTSARAKQWSSNKEKERKHAKRDAMQAITHAGAKA